MSTVSDMRLWSALMNMTFGAGMAERTAGVADAKVPERAQAQWSRANGMHAVVFELQYDKGYTELMKPSRQHRGKYTQVPSLLRLRLPLRTTMAGITFLRRAGAPFLTVPMTPGRSRRQGAC